ncbi:ABC-2 family transporter protein [Fructilactobacillus frigidiflavus]|uniref:ABC-2 family transporter protein n=1 Tax=Fructilactobacillus frigidiflavus TaxID=3242688 RepID=UPI003756F59C
MKYLVVATNSFFSSLTYRSNLLISLLSRIIQLSLSLFMWNSIYKSSSQIIGGYTKSEMFTYLLLTGILSLLFTFEPIFRISQIVQSGQISILLLRPIKVKWENLANFIGAKIIVILIAISAIFLFNPSTGLLLIFYLILAILLWYELMFLIGSFSFWIIQMWPLKPIINAFYLLFGGLLFPLDILPIPIYHLLMFSPIALVSSDLVESIIKYQGNHSAIMIYTFATFLWILFLRELSNIIFKRGLKRFEGNGL